MKILMITASFFPHQGGVESHVKRVSEELIKMGHEIGVLTPKTDENQKDYEKINEIVIFRYPRKSTLRTFFWLFKNRNIISGYDIIHCHDFTSFVFRYLPFLFIFPSKRVFITFHGFEGKQPIPQNIKTLRKISEKLTKGNICIGEFILKWYGTKTDYISYGAVDNILNHDEKDVEKNSILFVGRLEKDTGILEYLKTLKILKERYGFDYCFHVCGDGTLREYIKSYSEKNNLKIHLHGFIDPSNIFKKCSFAFVSGYLTILEAMIRKKLVFSIYENEIKKDYLILMPNSKKTMVISSSAEDLAKQMTYHFKNPSLIQKKVEAGYNFAKNQTWEKVANLYLDLWNKGNN